MHFADYFEQIQLVPEMWGAQASLQQHQDKLYLVAR